jgi:hypothetical protein
MIVAAIPMIKTPPTASPMMGPISRLFGAVVWVLTEVERLPDGPMDLVERVIAAGVLPRVWASVVPVGVTVDRTVDAC